MGPGGRRDDDIEGGKEAISQSWNDWPHAITGGKEVIRRAMASY
jgi:hypothetical protein